MIIDFHTHAWLPAYLDPSTRDYVRSISPAVATHGDRLSDPVFAADLLRSQGVERAVVLAEHCPQTSGNVRTETVLHFCSAAPDLYVPFASVHPDLDPDPAALLRRYLDQGARGLKLYPSYQFFYPDDPRHYPIYQVCQDAGVPLLLHVGSSVFPNTRLEYCHPRHLDAVARDFPDLPVIMAHGGRGHWYDECARLVARRPNAWIDVAGLVPSRLPEHFPTLAGLGDRMVFGSDWPAMPKSVLHNVTAIRRLGLEPDVLDRIVRRNAERLLGLERAAPPTELKPARSETPNPAPGSTVSP